MVPDDTMFVSERRPGTVDRIDMRLTAIVILCACMWVCGADVVHLKAAKAKLLGRLAGRHHKRGVLSAVPPFKLGHDIPLVTHSVIKPVVVSYPPTASVSAVKVPLSHPLLPRYPHPVGHRVPVPHPHYGLKFPHHTKSVVLPKPDQHFHHHHHHVAPRPVFPVVPATPLVPVPAPTAPVALPVPAPSPPVLPAPIIPQPSPLPPPLSVLPPHHFHVRPLLPAAPVVPASAPVVSPLFPVPPQIPYVIRPGNAVQTSLFATYPRFPFFPNFQIPLSQSAVRQLVPHQYLFPQGGPEGVLVNQAAPAPVPLEPTPTLVHASGEVPQPGVHFEPGVHYHAQPDVHVHPAQPEIHVQTAQPGLHLHHEQPEYLQPGVQVHSAQPELHFQPGVHVQPDVHLHGGSGQAHPDFHFQSGHPDVHLQPAHPDFHFQSGHPNVHLQPAHPDFHLQPGHPDVHLQPAHPDFHLQPAHPDTGLQHGHTDVHLQHAGHPGIHLQPQHPDIHLQPQPAHPDFHAHQTPSVDHNGWSPVPTQPHETPYPADGHQFTQEQGNQGHEHHEDQYHEYHHQLQHHIQQQLEQAQYEQQFHDHHQPSAEYGVPQGGYSQQQQGAEGRSAEGAAGDDDPQLYHNHIPLGLQPPIDRPLDHFR